MIDITNNQYDPLLQALTTHWLLSLKRMIDIRDNQYDPLLQALTTHWLLSLKRMIDITNNQYDPLLQALIIHWLLSLKRMIDITDNQCVIEPRRRGSKRRSFVLANSLQRKFNVYSHFIIGAINNIFPNVIMFHFQEVAIGVMKVNMVSRLPNIQFFILTLPVVLLMICFICALHHTLS